LGLCAFLAAALLVAGPANATHDPTHPFSGEWEMQFLDDDFLVRQGRAKTATIELKARDAAAVEMLARDSNAFRWGSWAPGECGEAADDYYVGKFTRGDDSGDVVGCVHPVSGIIHAVFKSRDGEGGFATAGGPGGYGIFPFGQPTERFNAFLFLRHLPDDGSKPEEVVAEGSLCGGSKPAAQRSQQQSKPQAGCKLDRVVFLDGTNAVQGVASSKLAVVGQRVYFLARVTSTVVPADLVLLFPKEVARGDIEVVQEAKASGLGCTPPSKLSTGTHAGKPYFVCTIDRPKSRVLVGVIVPKALSNKPLEVLLLVGKPKAPGQAREWIAKQTLAVNVDIEVVQPKPAPPKPVASPAAAKDPIEGHWVGFVPKPGRNLPGILKPVDPPPLLPDADVRITKAQNVDRVYNDIFATARGSAGEIYLNEPKPKTYPSGARSLIYDGSVAPTGLQLRAGKGLPVQIELIVPGSRAVVFPELCLGVAEQAKAPILCGLVGTRDKPDQRIVLRRVSD
jgi:hypothetical protein